MIRENVKNIISSLPEGVMLEAACKMRSKEDVLEAIDAGISIIGENYVQEAESLFNSIDREVRRHFIGHLQKNKVKKSIRIFDMIETVDSIGLAEEIDRCSLKENKIMEVLIEINSGEEDQKFGVLPKDAVSLIERISLLSNIRIKGLMTMGPILDDLEEIRPYFKKTKEIFSSIKGMNISNVSMEYLSMGMSHSYNLAIEEGANLIRIGTGIFGPR